MTTTVAIETKGLGKKYHIYKRPIDRLWQMLSRGRIRLYNEYWALNDLSVQIEPGQTVGVIGRNGSGKSTFLQLVCGTLSPSAGNLTVNGRIAALLELGAGFNPEFTGRENVFLAASVLGLDDKTIRQRYESIIEFAGIGDFIGQPVKIYSSGMYARLAFAVAAHVDADILIVDEILAVGDAAFTQRCMRFIRKFKEKGTILFVSHDTSSILNLCDKCLWLENGMVRDYGDTKDICHRYAASLEEEKDNDTSFKIGGTRKAPPVVLHNETDVRTNLLKESTLKNVIEVFDFDPDAPWFGQGGASIFDVSLHSKDNEEVRVPEGGEVTTLSIMARTKRPLTNPILGFYVKDRLGQRVFGDNTYITYKDSGLRVGESEFIRASFTFRMPYLSPGTYSINVAIAEGTQDDHVQHHWIDDAMFFEVLASHVQKGLMGIPMLDITLESVPAATSQHVG
jgi:lipopolysaccharide transport system ATP-binding protein